MVHQSRLFDEELITVDLITEEAGRRWWWWLFMPISRLVSGKDLQPDEFIIPSLIPDHPKIIHTCGTILDPAMVPNSMILCVELAVEGAGERYAWVRVYIYSMCQERYFR